LSYAHVEFLSEEGAEAACRASQTVGLFLFDRNLRVEYAKYSRGKSAPRLDGVTSLFFEDFKHGGEEAVLDIFKDFKARIVGVNCCKSLV